MDYNHEKRGCKDFEIKSFWEYDDFYFRSDVLLSSNIFKNFRKISLKDYELDPAKFLLAPRLAW